MQTPHPTLRKIRRRQALRVVHLIVFNWLLGAGIGAAFAGLLIWADIAHIGRLILNAQPVWPGLALLFGGFAVTFGSLVAGTAIMLIPAKDEPPDDPPGGRPIPVRAGAAAR